MDTDTSGTPQSAASSPAGGFRFSLKTLFVVITGVTFLIVLLIAAIQGHGSPSLAKRVHCQTNLKQIGLAMHNYLAVHGSFPPAYIADDRGRPMHSWRVLLLPYFETGSSNDYKALYDEYDFDEPWDGPHNRRLLDPMPPVYQCPTDHYAPAGATAYVAVVGDDTAWPFDSARTVADYTDGTSNTILVSEAAGLAIPWTAPRDLEFDLLDFNINAHTTYGARTKYSVSSMHQGGANVMMADASVRFLPNRISPTVLRGLLTIAGGEPVTPP